MSRALQTRPSWPGPRRGRGIGAALEAPIKRINLVAEVLERLRQSIIGGQFGRDGVLPSEGDLAASMGVSRTVIREAMRTLRAQGLVEMSQGKPARVRPADPQATIDSLKMLLRRTDTSLHQLIEVRRPLEGEIVALAARRATPDHIQRLEAAIEALEAAGTLDEKVEADIQFHNLLADATGNSVFGLLLTTLAGLMRQSRRRTISKTGVVLANKGHRQILEAIRRADPDAARAAMLEHLRLAERDLETQRG